VYILKCHFANLMRAVFWNDAPGCDFRGWASLPHLFLANTGSISERSEITRKGIAFDYSRLRRISKNSHSWRGPLGYIPP
jgi:hypothetical protein